MDLLTLVQVLSSRSLLAEVINRLVKEGHAAAFAGADPVAELQSAVRVSPVAGTDVVELQALGRSPQLLAAIVNTLIDSCRDRLFASHDDASRDTLLSLRDEVERLGVTIAEKRAQLGAFRTRSGVISSERGENEALARSKGLSESLNKANEDAAKAEARLHSLRESPAPATPSAVLVPQPWLTPPLAIDASLPIPERMLELTQHAVPQLSAKACLPRELTQDEVAALLAGAGHEGRLLCAILLLGLTVDELRELTPGNIDPAKQQLSVRGASARTLRLPDWLAQPLASYAGDDPAKPLFRNPLGQPLSESEIGARLTCAALDAELEEAQSVSPAILRHTCIAHLISQRSSGN